MNSSVSFFKYTGDRLTLYPLDVNQPVYEKTIEISSGKSSQIVVHRDGSLMYYSYVYSLEFGGSDFFGLSLLLNGTMITDFRKLYEFFDNALSDIIVRGRLLTLREDGKVCFGNENFGSDETERLMLLIKTDMNRLGRYTSPLPPVDYSIQADKHVTFDFQKDDERQIVQDAAVYPYTVVKRKRSAMSVSVTQSTLTSVFGSLMT